MTPFFVDIDFIEYLRFEKRYSQHTLDAYQRDIEQFFSFLGLSSSKASKVHSRDVRSWIVDLSDNAVKSTSINRKISSLRTYFNWLRKEGVIEQSPLRTIKGPKQQKRLPVFAKQTDLQVERLSLVFSDDFDGVRDQLMFELLYQTGMRLSELIELKVESISSGAAKVFGKRRKERIIPLSQDLIELINTYLAKRAVLDLKSEFLLVRESGEKLYPTFVYRRINKYLTQATDLEKRSPHVLRHTFATHMLNNGAGLEVIKELLGHASLAATQVYTHNSFAELTKVYSRSHPRGSKK
jgi:integrase/recombinase XerC